MRSYNAFLIIAVCIGHAAGIFIGMIIDRARQRRKKPVQNMSVYERFNLENLKRGPK